MLSKQLLKIKQNEKKNCMTHKCKHMPQPSNFLLMKGFAFEVGKELLGVSKWPVYSIQSISY